MSNSEITRAEVTAVVPGDPGQGPSPATSGNLLWQVLPLLRGRYWLAILLTVAGAITGGVLGFNSQSPTYKSTGIIRVRPYLPRILYESEQSGVMPMFDAFVGSQVELMRGQRVIDLAMQDEDWAALGRGLSSGQVASFRSSLSVVRPKGSELILVSFEDKDPDSARIGANAVIAAYEMLYSEQGGAGVDRTISFLEDYNEKLSSELRALNDRIFAIGDDLGSGALQQIYTFKLSELNKLESELRRAELELAIARGAEAAAAEARDDVSEQPEAPPTLEMLAIHVPELRSLLNAKRELDLQITADRQRLGPNHSQIVRLEAQRAATELQIEQVTQIYRQLGFGTDVLDMGATPDATHVVGSIAQREAGLQNIRKLYEEAKLETQELGRKAIQIEQLRAEADELKGKLEDTKRRLEALTVERNLGGRISVESMGDRPLAPAKDKRKQIAAAGAVGMGGAGLALVILLGLFDRRIRTVADIREGTPHSPLVGVLPQLHIDLAEPESALMAAHGVHQIRTALSGRSRAQKLVLAITSPSPGSGKTSLTLALGLSFAASRARTLLIDCDYLGGGLTAKLRKGARCRLGHLLRRHGVITEQQLSRALRVSAAGNELLGQVLVRLGYATPQQLEDALAEQRASVVGLRETLNGEPADDCFVETGISGLYLMPLGSADHQHLGELSEPALESLIEQLRRSFDVVIIDTGPVAGSLEASIATRVADKVVLTVARGEQRWRVQQALEKLAEWDVRVAGVVLNRARTPDLQSSGFSSSVSRRSGNTSGKPLPVRLQAVDNKDLSLGPIGSAVVALTQMPRGDA